MADGNLLLKTEEGLRVITIAGDTVLDLRSEDVGYGMHHDVTMLPSGNFVALVQTEREVFVEGMGTINQIGDGLLELTPDGDVVWEWWTFDHIDAARFPTELSLWGDRGSFDWTHANSVAYVESDDALLVSLRHQDWVLSIDRTTGNLNWRAGEEGDFELVSGLWFSGQHSAYLTSDGQLSVYDNGNERSSGGEYSRGVIYQLDTAAMTAEETFAYTVDPFTPFIGGHRVLDNGNSLLCAGGVFGVPVEVVEVSPTTGEAVWTLEIEDSLLFRAQRLPSFWHAEAVP
jgi:outer membrane protein assembly factor BamB